MDFADYVVVALPDGKRARVVHKDYAAANNLPVLPDESVIRHGRLASTFRLDGRTNKPKARLPKAIPTPKTSGKPASGEPGSTAVETTEES